MPKISTDAQKKIEELKAEIKRLRQQAKQKPSLDPAVVTKAVEDVKAMAKESGVKPSEFLSAMAKKMKLGVTIGRAARGGADIGNGRN